MPIKELNISFTITVEALAQALATSNKGMNIQVLGTATDPDMDAVLAAEEERLLLPAPQRGGLRSAIIHYLRKSPKTSHTSAELLAFFVPQGYTKHRVWNAISNSKAAGYLARTPRGKNYRLTKKGQNYAR